MRHSSGAEVGGGPARRSARKSGADAGWYLPPILVSAQQHSLPGRQGQSSPQMVQEQVSLIMTSSELVMDVLPGIAFCW